MQTIYIGSDHAGFEVKQYIIQSIKKRHQLQIEDCGTNSETEPVDYPDYAEKVVSEIAARNRALGILICGSGIGMSIKANRNSKIRAALCHNVQYAKLAVEHNNANVLVLAGRYLKPEEALEIVNAYLNAKFEGGRHQRRVDKL